MTNPNHSLRPDDGHRGRVQLIDGFACIWDSEALELPHGSQRLVALLGLTDRPLDRSYLSRTLWPNVDQEHALGALRTATWRLNRHCPGMLADHDGRGFRLVADVDIRSLLAEAHQLLAGDVAHQIFTTRLIQVFRSCPDLLPGWYDDWVHSYRERVRTIRVEVLRTAAIHVLADGYPAQALDLALAALRTEPLDENTHILVATIHLAQGNASEALRQYRLCTDLFTSELGVPPSAAFRALLTPVRSSRHVGFRLKP